MRVEDTSKNDKARMRGREKCEDIADCTEYIFSKKNTGGNGFIPVTTAEKKSGEMIYVQPTTTVHT